MFIVLRGKQRHEAFTTICAASCGGKNIKTFKDFIKGLTYKDTDGLGMTFSDDNLLNLSEAYTRFQGPTKELTLTGFIRLTTVEG